MLNIPGSSVYALKVICYTSAGFSYVALQGSAYKNCLALAGLKC